MLDVEAINDMSDWMFLLITAVSLLAFPAAAGLAALWKRGEEGKENGRRE